MNSPGKAPRIDLLDVNTPPMRAFHMTWFAFFLCFFAWFGMAPLMKVVRDELSLTKDQVGWCIIGSVAITVVARLFIGWLCDRIGPRLAYTGLLTLGSLPVMGIGLSRDFETFLLFRVLIGGIGASFVITQYHTSVMFAPNCVGTANATTAGWGNLGGGVTQLATPLLFSFLVGTVGLSSAAGWRAAMLVAGLLCFVMGIAYFLLTQDTPEGNFRALRAAGRLPARSSARGGMFVEACRDYRVWALFVAYGACFGIELVIHNVAALYFIDYFGLGLDAAGIAAGSFGVMALFARTLGGWFSDRWSARWGLRGRVWLLFIVLAGEGLSLMLFSQMRWLPAAIAVMAVFSIFVQMSAGATFAVVPFINRRALGSVAGIVGAGGNAGAVIGGFLFKGSLSWPTALLILGVLVTLSSTCALLVRFAVAEEPASGFAPVPEGESVVAAS